MTTRKISVGRTYSDDELRSIGVHPTEEQTSKITAVVSQADSLRQNGAYLEKWYDPRFSVGMTCLSLSNYASGMMQGRLQDSLEIYSGLQNMYLMEKNDDWCTVHFCYDPLRSVIIDECIEKNKGYNVLGRKGYTGFRMQDRLSDEEILDTALKMNVMGILTYDKTFGKDNKLKKKEYESESERMELQESYDRISSSARKKAIVCKNSDSVKDMGKKLERHYKRVKFNPEYFMRE